MRRLFPILLALAAPAAAQQAAPFVVAETGQGYAHLQDAVDAIRVGTGTILIAPGTYHECAIQQGGTITFRAREPGTAIFERTACEGKAVLVLRGDRSAVDGLVFRLIRVADGNGAGVRTEIGDLTVTRSMFLDSQEGILGGNPGRQRITIDRSTFSGLGQCHETNDCAHSIYLGLGGPVTITNSRFERGRGGHYVKVRAPHVTITGNSFDDTGGERTNYMIDLPEGAQGLISGNSFVQGRGKENHSGLIVVQAEHRSFSSAGLRIEGNDARLAPGAPTNPAFVADLSGDRLAVGANRLGAGIRMFERR